MSAKTGQLQHLLHRRPRISPTQPSGVKELIHARTLLDKHAKSLDAAQRARRDEVGWLCIATIPTGPSHPLMPSSMRQFWERYPEASVTLKSA